MGLNSINEKLLSKSAGWEAMKRARQYLSTGAVLKADWDQSKAMGSVQAGGQVYRAGLYFESELDIENQCTCRESRQSGMLCAHSVAVALGTLHPEMVGSKESLSPPTKSVSHDKAASQEPDKPKQIRPWFQHEDGAAIGLSFRFLVARTTLAQWFPTELTVMFEALCDGQSMPVMAVDKHVPYRIDPQDRDLMQWLQEDKQLELGPALRMPSDAFSGVLEKLRRPEQLMLGRQEPVEIVNEPWVPPIQVRQLESGSLVLTHQVQVLPEGFIPGTPSWVFLSGRLQPMGLAPEWMGILQQPLEIAREHLPLALQRLEQWESLGHPLEWLGERPSISIVDGDPSIRLSLEGGLARLDARLHACYGDHHVQILPSSGSVQVWMPDPSVVNRFILRQPKQETQALDRLVRAGFQYLPNSQVLRLEGQESVIRFLAGPYLSMRRHWQVNLEERLSGSMEKNLECIEPEVRMSQGSGDWFDFSVSFPTSAGTQMTQEEVLSLMRSGRSYQRRPSDGKVLVLDTQSLEEFQEVLVDVQPQQHQGSYRVRKVQAGFLESTFRTQGWKVERGSHVAGLKPHVESSLREELEMSLPTLASKLRAYQRYGVQWIGQLFERGYGGILADEMGLGKTLQVLAWVRLQALQQPAAPCLVICPTSLVFNWVTEAKKWLPELKVMGVEGPHRETALGQIAAQELVVTSYALIRRDMHHYQQHSFRAVFLDEAQFIKNRETQIAKAVKSLRCEHRLVITGTPLENSVFDLWSIFDFLMPGYLGSARDFRERYEQPITQGDNPSLNRLQRRVGPFLLRRTKQEVSPEIPERLDHVLLCDLSEEQRSVYQQVMELGRSQLLEVAHQKNPSSKSRMMVLTSILRMRQICCDARLVMTEEKALKRPSGKLEVFESLLETCLDGGHRLLVFSQFVGMLALLRESLESRGLDYCLLDGSTTHRGKVVERFERSLVPVFLISLKAGGTGLNLTGADTVVHFDPWWNPAVEAQATARAHRLGQKRVVNNYKLIARDTIEEKVLKLQQQKQSQLEAMLESGNPQLGEGLGWDEIAGLFDPLDDSH